MRTLKGEIDWQAVGDAVLIVVTSVVLAFAIWTVLNSAAEAVIRWLER